MINAQMSIFDFINLNSDAPELDFSKYFEKEKMVAYRGPILCAIPKILEKNADLTSFQDVASQRIKEYDKTGLYLINNNVFDLPKNPVIGNNDELTLITDLDQPDLKFLKDKIYSLDKVVLEDLYAQDECSLKINRDELDVIRNSRGGVTFNRDLVDTWAQNKFAKPKIREEILESLMGGNIQKTREYSALLKKENKDSFENIFPLSFLNFDGMRFLRVGKVKEYGSPIYDVGNGLVFNHLNNYVLGMHKTKYLNLTANLKIYQN